ncbi:UNVERIFIED_CONTAM: hypothetical protein HHA_453550 [Hammondia hammondi]|eukprot:XP_008886837.1 hypothetical protein HHA_453550 [Hammondia hammondi]
MNEREDAVFLSSATKRCQFYPRGLFFSRLLRPDFLLRSPSLLPPVHECIGGCFAQKRDLLEQPPKPRKNRNFLLDHFFRLSSLHRDYYGKLRRGRRERTCSPGSLSRVQQSRRLAARPLPPVALSSVMRALSFFPSSNLLPRRLTESRRKQRMPEKVI